MIKCYYFGCKSKLEIGHYLFTNDGNGRYLQHLEGGFRVDSLDGMIKAGEQSKATYFNLCGWSFITMGDYSADGRSASNASFMAQGKFSFEELLELARKVWPKKVKRIEDAASITLIRY